MGVDLDAIREEAAQIDNHLQQTASERSSCHVSAHRIMKLAV